MSDAQKILEVAKRRKAITFGEIRLTSGEISRYYFDGRLITLDPEGAYYIARAFLPRLKKCGAEAIAGPTLGADPIISSIVVMSYTESDPIVGLIVRQKAKHHGSKNIIEGPIRPGAAVAVVDDTCSTGGSLIHAIETIEAAGCRVVKVMCVLDRHMGGSDEIKKRGYDFLALLSADKEGRISTSAT